MRAAEAAPVWRVDPRNGKRRGRVGTADTADTADAAGRAAHTAGGASARESAVEGTGR